MDLVSKLMAFEEGELSLRGTVELFSDLIKSGRINFLQGTYGRCGQSLIDMGIIKPNGEIDEEVYERESERLDDED